MGNGFVSNRNPYAHWAYTFPDSLAATPTKTCVFANSSTKYDQVRRTAGRDLLCAPCRVVVLHYVTGGSPEGGRSWLFVELLL